MSSSSAAEITEVLDGLLGYAKRFCDLDFEALDGPRRLDILVSAEQIIRMVSGAGPVLLTQLAEQSSNAELGGRLPTVLADRLRITVAEATGRIRTAQDLGPRHTLTGEALLPRMPATAAARGHGSIGDGHVNVIRDFLHALPTAITPAAAGEAERQLVGFAADQRPDELRKLAAKLFDRMAPDGTPPEDAERERARTRGITMGRQDKNLMSKISGWVDPELRAVLESITAKLGAPGHCNRDDEQPVVDAEPSEQAARHDLRSTAQRFHDALLTAGRAVLMSDTLGQHHGLPVSIVVTTTLAELEAAAGVGLTGGGTLLPMSDVIRLARHAHHYLGVFDNGKALALYHTKRLASPAQRLVLHAKSRGCTFPGCTVTGYHAEVHHVLPYSQTGHTDIDELDFACPSHHRLADHGWHTTINTAGDTEWIPPPHLDHGQPRTNRYHHPEKLLNPPDKPD